ncbi:hypothetical protein FIU86_13845 [Roseovarius sp. THAF9]|uniref:hypothetical protein n=1 Tax=Roseovarius sp. THAF9 TaxID=2587847 RepID=UPI00126879D2|nr:hypothetical protein [Roseovarius sp. THAF9]QFT93928.1 hypothetical protein FIU86_13845 [Roseovarius sp. THAF9]
MKFRSLLLAFLLSGCAEFILEQQVQGVEGTHRQLDDFDDMKMLACPRTSKNSHSCSLSGAVRLAFDQADAYARAARQSQNIQDVSTGALIIAAGATVLGAVDGVSDETLVRRATGAVAVQQAGSRAVPKTAIQSLYEGASRMNCIALSGSLYEEVDLEDYSPGSSSNAIPVQFASFVMVLAMREVEYRTLYGTTREVANFSALVQAFSAAITDVSGIPEIPEEDGNISAQSSASASDTGGGTVSVIVQNAALERFFKVVAGCLSSDGVAPETKDD